MKDLDVLIVGAGLSGLTTAVSLQSSGLKVALLDKGRGPGGRMATRRAGATAWDHGAQFFSVKTPDFRNFIRNAAEAGVVKDWTPAHLADAHPRKVCVKGMNDLPKFLAAGLSLYSGCKVVKISQQQGWSLTTEDGSIWQSRCLVLTIPAPQALELLRNSQVALPEATAVLEHIDYHPCLAVLARLDQPAALPAPGGLSLEDHPVAWMADNFQKGISQEPSLTIHASPAFSREYLEGDLQAAGGLLLSAAQPYLGPVRALNFQVHRWRYSLAYKRYRDSFFVADADFPLLLGGDGFGEFGHIEGAFLSGRAMADWIAGDGFQYFPEKAADKQ